MLFFLSFQTFTTTTHITMCDIIAQWTMMAHIQDGTMATGLTPLHVAASQGDVEVIKRLLQSGSVASVDAQDDLQGNTALHEAAWKGYSQTIEVLMKYKANAYIKNKGGFTPLHLACQQGHNESARILLLNKCKPDVKNNYGDTPLHTSCRYGHAGVARILISAFCDVSPVNKNGDSPLHITAGQSPSLCLPCL
jgi:ankyrin repeat protein